MSFHLLQFEHLLSNLLENISVEEHLTKIVTEIESAFSFTSLGIFLQTENPEIYQLNISSKISYEFTKNAIFTKGDPLLIELSELKMLNIENPGRYLMEHDYSQLLIFPIHFKKELLGFFFIDKEESNFENEQIAQLKIFVSIMSFVVEINSIDNEMRSSKESFGKAKIYAYNHFLQKARFTFSLMVRYGRDVSLTFIKLGNYEKIVSKIGEKATNIIKKDIGEILSTFLRDTDIVGSIYKDSFAIFMPETSTDTSALPNERIRSLISQLIKDKEIVVGYGVSSRNEYTNNLDKLLTLAEKASIESLKTENNEIMFLNE